MIQCKAGGLARQHRAVVEVTPARRYHVVLLAMLTAEFANTALVAAFEADAPLLLAFLRALVTAHAGAVPFRRRHPAHRDYQARRCDEGLCVFTRFLLGSLQFSDISIRDLYAAFARLNVRHTYNAVESPRAKLGCLHLGLSVMLRHGRNMTLILA